MKGFTPTKESHGFSPALLWSGCRATKSRRSGSESAELSSATGLPARGAYEKVSQEKTLPH